MNESHRRARIHRGLSRRSRPPDRIRRSPRSEADHRHGGAHLHRHHKGTDDERPEDCVARTAADIDTSAGHGRAGSTGEAQPEPDRVEGWTAPAVDAPITGADEAGLVGGRGEAEGATDATATRHARAADTAGPIETAGAES
jgi:hypothetical protein